MQDIEEIDVAPQRKRHIQEAATDQEKAQIMAVLGAVQYNVQKTGPEEAAACGLLQSKRPQATVQDLVSVNKMVGRMKARADRCLPIHSHVGSSLVVICWADAAF